MTAPPASVLAGRLDEIAVPDGWALVDESASSGSNCFDVCPSVCRLYHPIDDPTVAIERGVDWFERDGYALERVDFWPTPRYEGRATRQYLTIQVDRHYEFTSDDFTEVVSVCLRGSEVP